MKWTKIPRAAWDIMKVLLNGEMPMAERMTVAGALSKLKWRLHTDQATVTELDLAGRRMRLFNDADTQFVLKEIWVDRVYEPVKELQPLRLLDLGANVGLGILFFIRRFPSLKDVVAYEPEPSCFALLKANVPEALVHREAVGAGEGTMFVSSKAGVVNARVRVEGEGETVHLVSMRSLLLQQWDMVKMDIEGAEWEVFEDLLKDVTQLSACGYWMVEFHDSPQQAVRSAQIREAFASIGYKNMQKGSVMHFYHDGPAQLK